MAYCIPGGSHALPLVIPVPCTWYLLPCISVFSPSTYAIHPSLYGIENTSAFLSEREIFPPISLFWVFISVRTSSLSFSGLPVDPCHWLRVYLKAVKAVNSCIFKGEGDRMTVPLLYPVLQRKLCLPLYALYLSVKIRIDFLRKRPPSWMDAF